MTTIDAGELLLYCVAPTLEEIESGLAGTIAGAVHHATGQPIRGIPIPLE